MAQTKVKTAVVRYLRHLARRKLSKSYQQEVRNVLARVVKRYGDRRVGSLTSRMIAFLLGKLGGRAQKNTYSHYARVCWYFFEFCKTKGWVKENYVRQTNTDYIRKPYFFTPLQVKKLFEALPLSSEVRDACTIMYLAGLSLTDLDFIVRPEYINKTLVLKDRTVSAPEIVFDVLCRRRFFNLNRLRKSFVATMKSLEFPGYTRMWQNTYLIRHFHAHTPFAVMRRQTGFSSDQKVKEKLRRLLDLPKDFFSRQRTAYADYA